MIFRFFAYRRSECSTFIINIEDYYDIVLDKQILKEDIHQDLYNTLINENPIYFNFFSTKIHGGIINIDFKFKDDEKYEYIDVYKRLKDQIFKLKLNFLLK